jgi:hypothetical protein
LADKLVRLVLSEQDDAVFWHKLGSAFRGSGASAGADRADAARATGIWSAQEAFPEALRETDQQTHQEVHQEVHGVSRELALFLADCRAVLSEERGPQGLEQIGQRLQELVADAKFRSLYFGAAVTAGNRAIHEDPGRALRFLTHILPEAYVSPPHDHGSFWVIYAQVSEHSEMTEWRRGETTEDASDAFTPVRKYRLDPGDVRVFPRGAIHSIDCPAGTRYVRVMGQL